MEVLKQEIFSYLEKQRSPLGIRRLERTLRLPVSERSYLKSILREMVQEGRIRRTTNGLYERVATPRKRPVAGVSLGPIGSGHVHRLETTGVAICREPCGKQTRVQWPRRLAGSPVVGDELVWAATRKNNGVALGIAQQNHAVCFADLPGCGSKYQADPLTPGTPMDSWIPFLIQHFSLAHPWASPSVLQMEDTECSGRHNLSHIDVHGMMGLHGNLFLGVSIEPSPSGWTLGLHIPDVTACLPLDSREDRESRWRGTSVTLHDWSSALTPGVDLVPKNQHERPFSMPALSLMLRLGNDLIIAGWQMETTTVQIQNMVTPVDRERLFHARNKPADYPDNQVWSVFRTVVALMKDIRPGVPHGPHVKHLDTPLQHLCVLVEEMMGRIMKERNIGGIFHPYRREATDLPAPSLFWPVFSSIPVEHDGAVRRAPFADPLNHYAAQVNHRMVKSWLKREPAAFSGNQLASLSTGCAWRDRLRTAAERAVRLLDHLHDLKKTGVSMVPVKILSQRGDFMRVWLPDSGLTAWIIPDRQAGTPVSIDRLVPDLDLPKLPQLDLRP